MLSTTSTSFILFTFTIVGGALGQANMATTITLNPNTSFCTFEDLKKGDNVQFGARYQMKDGTMSVEMTSPNSVLYKAASDSSNSIAFKPHEDGRYKLCFINANNSPRTVTFTLIESADDLKTNGDPTQQELQALVDGLKSIKTEQEFLMRREIEHKQIAIRTNRRIIYWFLFQIALIAGTTFWQIKSLKGFFDTRRVV